MHLATAFFSGEKPMDFVMGVLGDVFTLKGLLYFGMAGLLIGFGFWLGFRTSRGFQKISLETIEELRQQQKDELFEQWQQLQDNPVPPRIFLPGEMTFENTREATDTELQKIHTGLQRLKNMGCRFEAAAHHKFMDGDKGVFMTRYALYTPKNVIMWETYYDPPRKGGFPVVYETGALVLWNEMAPLFLRLTWPDTQMRMLKEVFDA